MYSRHSKVCIYVSAGTMIPNMDESQGMTLVTGKQVRMSLIISKGCNHLWSVPMFGKKSIIQCRVVCRFMR